MPWLLLAWFVACVFLSQAVCLLLMVYHFRRTQRAMNHTILRLKEVEGSMTDKIIRFRTPRSEL